MESVRIRKITIENTVNGTESTSLPKIELRRQNLLNHFQMFLARYYIVIALFIISILISYSYFSIYPINTIFFRYGHPYELGWQENDLLETAKFIDVKLNGPEAIAFDSNGSFYTGLRNGLIIRVDPGGHIEKIIRTGKEIDDRICNDESKWNVADPSCGRPFGLRMKPGTKYLYVADTFYGLVKIDVDKKTKEIILNSNDTRFGNKPLKCTEDLDVDGDNIYFVDSTDKHTLNEAIEDIIFSYSSGRVFRYNEKKDKLDLLIDHLYYPNGIQLTPNKDALLISEFSKARIIKLHLEGLYKGKSELFAELPGLSDAIRLTDLNTLLVPFVVVFPKHGSLSGYFGKFPVLRSIIGYFINHSVIMNIWPKYGLVAEYDLQGNILKSWHDKHGKNVKFITNAVLYDKKLYLGSYSGNKIAVVDY